MLMTLQCTLLCTKFDVRIHVCDVKMDIMMQNHYHERVLSFEVAMSYDA